MPRIRCHYPDCVFNGEGICSASGIELDPDTGCLTYSQSAKRMAGEWEDEEDLDDDWADLGSGLKDEGDKDWLEDDEDFE